MKPLWTQTSSDMDHRFSSGGFAKAGGNHQSLAFAVAAFSRVLTESPVAKVLHELAGYRIEPLENGDNMIHGTKSIIYDYGCALGDGTAYIKSIFPMARVVGVDISPMATQIAAQRWPFCEFYPGDIQKPYQIDYSIIYTSHTLEHLENPAETVRGLLARTSILIAVVPPIPEVRSKGDSSHVGAVPIQRWLDELEEPIYTESYNTLRPDGESGGVILEGNLLLVWRGKQ